MPLVVAVAVVVPDEPLAAHVVKCNRVSLFIIC